MALWEESVDDLYAQPFVENPDAGIEAYEQLAEQLARVSTAIDRSFQAMYIQPWSGQSNSPAQGAEYSHVMLTITRSNMVHLPMVFGPTIWIEEETTDAGENGPELIRTGRLYRLLEPLIFSCGETGPFTVEAIAEKPGYGYNNPLPGTIKYVRQPGSIFANDQAILSMHGEILTVANKADVPTPDMIGQYVRLTSGADAGKLSRIISYQGPQPPISGGTLTLEFINVIEVASVTGAFIPGEVVTLTDESGPPIVKAQGNFLKQTFDAVANLYRITFSFNEVISTGGSGLHLRGMNGADCTIQGFLYSSVFSNNSSVSWEIVDWLIDWGVTVTNTESPVNGRIAMLDALGDERKLQRTTLQSDDEYREVLGQIADVVSPNAIRRAINRILAPHGLTACLREVGQELYPGFYLDHDAYDYTPNDVRYRNRVYLDYASFRAFFRVGVPALNWGEYGFAYDAGPSNAYDASPALAFYDGYPIGAAQIYRRIWDALNLIKAGGVGFELYIEVQGCI